MNFQKIVGNIRMTYLSRHDWTSTLVRVVWIQLMKCLHALLRQHLENGHLLYCSSSWTLWHWMHTPFASISK